MSSEIHQLATELWPINRSITGVGVRQTLRHLQNVVPSLRIHSVKSGTRVFDWTVPKEWVVESAKIVDPFGKEICNIESNNLHLVGYSIPFSGELKLADLQYHLYSIPDKPNAIPYVTSYYQENWGFCIAENERKKLKEGIYKVSINTKLFDGDLNYGEILIKGKSNKEIFLSTYICHPSMANNEISGPCVAIFLAKWLSQKANLEYSYRIIFVPETIGSITYLSLNLEHLKKNVIAGFNISCVGDDRTYSYLPSRDGNTLSDRVALHVLKHMAPEFKKYTWLDRGSDERQYCSPGVDLPIASIMRSKYGEYPEYHTSLDDLQNVVTPDGLSGGYSALRLAIELIENDHVYRSVFKCEPQMGRRGLYPNISQKNSAWDVQVMMDVLSYCDGENSVLEISEYLGRPAWELYEVISTLVDHALISRVV